MSVSGMMNTTVSIANESQTKDSLGYQSAPTLAVVETDVPARVSDMTPDRAIRIYGKYDAVHQKRIAFDADHNLIPAKSWIVWNGDSYSVTSVQNAGGNLNTVWFVDAILKPFGG